MRLLAQDWVSLFAGTSGSFSFRRHFLCLHFTVMIHDGALLVNTGIVPPREMW